MPAWTSIRYWSAPAVAMPPGTMRPNALPVSCEVPTANQLGVLSTIRCSSHTARKLAASNPSAMATQSTSSVRRSRQEVKTSTRLGNSR